MHETTRAILHLDLDAFYASIEQRDHPEYRGKPVIVGADPRRGLGRGEASLRLLRAQRHPSELQGHGAAASAATASEGKLNGSLYRISRSRPARG